MNFRIELEGRVHRGQWYPVTWDGDPPKQDAISDADIREIAGKFDVPAAAVDAFRQVEAAGSGFFLQDAPPARPKILFEAHHFSKHTKHVFDYEYPQISARRWDRRLYKSGPAEYERLKLAFGLNARAALMSASWGLGQVLGSNFKVAGALNVFEFVEQAFEGERAQLRHMMTFLVSNQLLGAMRSNEWKRLARGYNGPAYAKNHYDTKLAAAARTSRFA